jgi:hypothetical protein
MTRKRLLIALAVVLALPQVGQAQWAVVDASAIQQLLLQYRTQLTQYTTQLQQYKNQVDQLKNQLEQVYYAYMTVQQGITNLKQLNLNRAEDLLRLGNELQRKLSEAEYIGYTAQRAWNQAQNVYPQIQRVLSAPQQRQLQRQYAAVQRDAARVGILTQAMSQDQQAYQNYWADLMAKAQAAQGNLEIQQVQAQGQGLLGSQLLAIQQQLATQAREQSQRSLKEAGETELEQNALEATGKTLDTTYAPQGKSLSLTTGKD